MKTTSKKISPLIVLAMCVALGGINTTLGQSYQGSQPSTPNTDAQTSQSAGGQDQNSTVTIGAPNKFNKASSLIGMEVRNLQHERLGDVKDIVIDPQSERVAYVVLNRGSILTGEKLLAVPLNAFTPSDDQKYLILRADKAKVEAAAGFDRKDWPSATNPSWGAEPFWDQNPQQQNYYQPNGQPEGSARGGATTMENNVNNATPETTTNSPSGPNNQ